MPGKIFVIIPAYNEGTAIEAVIHDLMEKMPVIEVVVVNDGSRDNTRQVIEALPVHALTHPLNLGQGGALQTGIDYAVLQGADYLVTFDADGQHRPEDIPSLIEPLESGEVDIVLGSRFLKAGLTNATLKRRLLLKAATLFTRITTRLPLTDTHNGLRAFTRATAGKLRIEQNGMAHASEILEKISRLGLRWKEVPVIIRYSDYSQAKGQRASNMINILWDLMLGR